VCVFRHPLLSVQDVVAEAAGRVDLGDVFEQWISAYREILDRHMETGDWLVIEADEVATEAGRQRLGSFLGVEVDGSLVDPGLVRDVPEGMEVPDEALRLYERLRQCAGRKGAPRRADRPRVAVLAVVRDGDEPQLPALAHDVARLCAVRARLLVVDGTGRKEIQGAFPSYSAALEEIDEEVVALARPGCTLVPSRLVHALAALERGADLVTCDYALADGSGAFVDRASPAEMADAPGPFWEAGLTLRREVLATIRSTAFFPTELELYRRHLDTPRHTHVTELGFAVDEDLYAASFERSVDDAALVSLAAREPAASPALTVSLEATDPIRLAASLEGFCRQRVAPDTFEVVVADRTGAGGDLLLGLELPIRVRVFHCPGKDEAAAHNRAAGAARGEVVLFTSERYAPDPHAIERHLAAHAPSRDGSGAFFALVGSLEEPESARRTALGRHLQRLTCEETPRSVAGSAFRIGNASIARVDFSTLGGFDESFGAGFDAELGQRLETTGCHVFHDPWTRFTRLAPTTFADLRRRTVEEACTSARLAGRAPLETAGPVDRTREEAGEELAAIDLAQLEENGACADLVTESEGRLEILLAELKDAWRASVSGGPSEVTEEQPMLRAVPRPPGRRRSPQLSVVIPTHDRPRELLALLDHLALQDLSPDRFEVFVVDDASTEPVSERIDPCGYPFELYLMAQAGGGPGLARNRAVARARGDVVLYLNDDAVPGRRLLSRHLDHHRHASFPRAVLGAFTLLPEHRRHSIGEYVETTTALFDQPLMKPGEYYRGLCFCSGNISVRREALEAVGGFDESFLYAGGEDWELGHRLELEQWIRVLYDPALECGHDHAIRVDSILGRKRVVGWSLAKIQEKYGDLDLLPLPSWPAADEDWERTAEEVERMRPKIESLRQRVEALCDEEVARRTGPTAVDRILEPLQEAERLEILAGALCWRHGVLPVDGQDADSPAIPRHKSA